ncbi:MAG: hypothetical protein WBN22_02295 [Verrucomicrobiia bacterium]
MNEAFAFLPVQGLSHLLDSRFVHNPLQSFKPATLFQFGFAFPNSTYASNTAEFKSDRAI